MSSNFENRALCVGVLVDLYQREESGGHVKCWERFAEAAAAEDQGIDLSVHFLGREAGMTSLAEHVRYIRHRPVLSTERLPFLDQIADHTDLAPRHPGLRPYLREYDVLHTTHPLFSFGRTAFSHARRSGTPLVSSLHTDTPRYAEIFTAQIVRRLFGTGTTGRLLLDRWRVHERRAGAMRRRLEDHWRRCARVLVSQPDDLARVSEVVGRNRVSFLRRGIDPDAFDPRYRDRERLLKAFSIAADRTVLLYVGRIDAAKNAAAFANVLHALRARGLPVHGLMIGAGAERERLLAQGGPALSLPGALPQSELAWIYASADLFVFPSETEMHSNAVLEAKACGLPVVVAARGGAAALVARNGEDGIIVEGHDTESWATAIAPLLAHPERRAAMGRAAREHAVSRIPSWRTVLQEDLYPVWRSVAQR